MQPTKEKVEELVDELVDCLVQENAAKEAFKSIIEVTKEDYEDFDTAILSAAARKRYKQVYNTEAYEKEKVKVETVYELVEGLK